MSLRSEIVINRQCDLMIALSRQQNRYQVEITEGPHKRVLLTINQVDKTIHVNNPVDTYLGKIHYGNMHGWKIWPSDAWKEQGITQDSWPEVQVILGAALRVMLEQQVVDTRAAIEQ